MKNYFRCLCALTLCGGGSAFAENPTDGESIRPSTCYVSALGDIGQVTCTDADNVPSPLQTVSIGLITEKEDESIPQQMRLTLQNIDKPEQVYGDYQFTMDTGEEIVIAIGPASSDDGAQEVRGGRGGGRGGGYRGGGAYRGGAAYRGGGAYRGRGYAYRGGGRYYRGAAVVGGALVGTAAGVAASQYYGSGCDPNYSDCSGYGYGPGYYAPGAVVGGAVAAGAYRRGGAVYRGRGGGAHVAHRGGGGHRR